MNSSRPDLIALVARNNDLSIKAATKLVDSVLSGIVTLAENGTLTIYEFGRFDFHKRNARVIKTAINREDAVKVPQRKALRFRAAPALIIVTE